MAIWNVCAAQLEGKNEAIGRFEQLGQGLESTGRVDSAYLEYLWLMTSLHRNSNNLPKADSTNTLLLNYTESLSEESSLRTKGMVHAQIHQNMISMIRRDLENGIPNSIKTLELAQSSKDTNLIIEAGYYLSEFYVLSRNLPEFLNLVEYNYQLDSVRSNKSRMYSSVIFQWLDALIYSGQRFDKVDELIDELEASPHLLARSLEYRLMYLGRLDEESPAFQKQLKRFEARNLHHLIHLLDSTSASQLTPNNYTHFLIASAKAFFQHEEHNAAFTNMQLAFENTEKVYSSKLSKDLAEIETRRVKREKDIEIAAEKEKTQLYVFLAISAALLLFVGLLVIVLLVRQSKQLRAKNDEIEQQRLQLEEADGEKAILLKEIHHRIKNNFQIVSSLLELQSRGIEDEKARELAEEGKNRVKSMALIHQRLYQNDDLLISFDEYTKALVDEIVDMYAPEEAIDLKIEAANVHLDVDTAIPLGLIINELVTNAFKYGLEQSEKKLDIILQKAGETEYHLTVKDNGQGLPQGFKMEQSNSLGLRLVKRLTKQLKGSVKVLNENGAVFHISFRDSEGRAALS